LKGVCKKKRKKKNKKMKKKKKKKNKERRLNTVIHRGRGHSLGREA